jgi:quercetin dioxygenase-like cupin family protein
MEHSLELNPGQTLHLRRHGALRLQMQQGRIWLTRSDDPADHVVVAGQALQVPPGRSTVIENDGRQPALLTLQPAPGLQHRRAGHLSGIKWPACRVDRRAM